MLIISDFSKTFTSADMPTTWSVFVKSGILGEAYIADRNALFDSNFPFEQAWNIEKTEEWFLKHAELFAKYWLTQDQINATVMDDRYFVPRAGVREFLDYVIANQIPLVIVTSGVSDFVTSWFRERFQYTPEIVFGNELIFSEGVVVGVVPESAICPLDKTVEIELEDGNERVILLGDNIEDTRMIKNPTQTIGFTDEDRGFTVKLGKEGSMKDVIEYLK